MKPPKITEEKLRTLMCCFVADFESKHSEQLDKLSTHDFFLTERMGCAKAAGLNYEYPATIKEDKTLVTVGASAYVSAVKTLASRELVKFSEKSPLIFNLTTKGFSETKAEEKRRNRTNVEKSLDFCKEHPGAVKLIAGIIALISTVIAAVVKYT